MEPSDIDIETVATELLDAAVDATPSWVAMRVADVAAAQGLTIDGALVDEAGTRAQRFVEDRLGALLRADIDAQRSTPLSVFRDAVRFPVEVLHAAGGREVQRADTVRWAFPNDPFGISPASLADIGDRVHVAGIVWGAAKAGLHLQRRRAEGMA